MGDSNITTPVENSVYVEEPSSLDAEPPATAAEKVAVIVCHGMGQQVRFETIDTVARMLRDRHDRDRGAPTKISARMVKPDGSERAMGRAEITVAGNDAGNPHEVHVYEAYWAPLTEGKATLADVNNFLFNAGFSGIKYAFKSGFPRWMFGGTRYISHGLPARMGILGQFLLALLVLWSLIFINSVIVSVFAAKLLGAPGNWASGTLLSSLTKDLFPLAVCGTALAAAFFVVWLNRRIHRNWKIRFSLPLPKAFGKLLWPLIWLTIFLVPVTAALMLGHIVFQDDSAPRADPGFSGFSLTVGMVALGVSALARKFFLQFVGDVAAYISSHTVNKFFEVRQAIQDLSCHVARSVYASKNPRYDRIIVVGHSLGSVIAYDTLNALITEDAAAGGTLEVVDRTEALITFGSPLDKTAFIFRTQKSDDAQVQEALGAAVQPMIVDYSKRPNHWINIYSRNDWVSGSLDYYDGGNPGDPQASQKKVRNCRDPDANIPLMAHVQYWENPLLAQILYDAITAPAALGNRP